MNSPSRVFRTATAIVCLMLTRAAMAGPNAPSPPPASPAVAPAHDLTAADLGAWLDGFLPTALRDEDIAGAVVTVVKDGKVLFEKGYGYSDIATLSPMDPERTVVGVGSISKLFTWTAVMQLVQAGKIDLSGNINGYLDFKIPMDFGQPITMRELMTHTAGFGEQTKSYQTKPPHTLSAYVHLAPVPDELYPPGKIPAYSNYGALLAGYIVQRVSGEPFQVYVQQHILDPLGMTHSAFCYPPPPSVMAHMAKSYGLASSEEVLPASANDWDPRCEPAGGLFATAGDISHFMLAHLQGGRYGSAQILDPATTAEMHKTAFVPIPGAPGIALGWFDGDANGYHIISHDGDLTGFHSDLDLLPDQDVGFFISMNSDGRGDLLGGALQVRTSLFQRFMDRYFPPRIGISEPAGPPNLRDAHRVAGYYEVSRPAAKHNFMSALYMLLQVRVTALRNGNIETPGLLSLTNGRPQQWREISPSRWRLVGAREELYLRIRDGRVREWVPDGIGITGLVLLPVPFMLSEGLNVPLLIATILILFLTSIAWPVRALAARRSISVPSSCNASDQVRFVSRIMAVAATVYLLAWPVLVMGGIANLWTLGPELDPWIRFVQLLGLLCVVGAGFAVWNVWRAWTRKRRWREKAWSALMALALIYVVWFSFLFSLISVHLNY